MADTFGAEAPAVAAQYPPERFGDSAALAYAAAVGDGIFACPIDAMAASLAPRTPVYAYEFNDRTAPTPEPFKAVPFPIGAGHALELRYLFDMGGAPPLNGPQRALSDQMIAYWSRFVSAGAPDVAGQTPWPRLDPTRPQRLSLQTSGPVVTTDFAERHRCGFWASRG
jgi:para-nitrobenzyl esterase